MLLVVFLTWIFQAMEVDAAITLWQWFSDHVLLTILMIIFLA